MQYVLTIQFPDMHEETEEEYSDPWHALARVKELQAMPWVQSGTPPMTLVDSAGVEIDIDTGLYVDTGAYAAQCPVTEAIADDTAARDSGVHCTGNVDYAPNPEVELERVRRIFNEQERMQIAQLDRVMRSPDANVEAVREAMFQRSEFGLRKYGVTTERTDIDKAGWLQHLQEELMDATVYVQCLKNEVEAENRRLRTLIADAYEQGYEQCAQDGAADYPQRNEDKDEYVAAVMAKLAKQANEK